MYWNKAQGRWVPQISIYLALIPTWLFPASITAQRAVTGIVTLICLIVTSLTLKKTGILDTLWWLPFGLATIIPVLMLHNRLAFETSNAIFGILVSISLYLTYRLYHHSYLLAFILSASFTFYSHWSGSIVISALTLMLIVVDLYYHCKVAKANPRFMLTSFILALVCAIPFIRFIAFHPSGIIEQLTILRSDLAVSNYKTTSILNGMGRYLTAYNPYYWFKYNYVPTELRHLWKDRPFVSTFLLPPFLLGLTVTLTKFWQIVPRTLLIGLLAGGLPVLVADLHVQRVFYVLAPAIIIMAIGIKVAHDKGGKKVWVFILLTTIAYNSWKMLNEFQSAHLWYHDYSLTGLQWGAKSVFKEAIPKLLAAHPSITIITSGQWANGADNFPPFFLTNQELARVRGVPFDIFLPAEDQKIDQNWVFMLSPPEKERIINSKKFQPLKPLLEIPYPDQSQGFTFTRLQYVPDIDQILAPERAWFLTPQQKEISIGTTVAYATYSRLDLGSIEEAFDGNHFTVARGLMANPFELDLQFKNAIKTNKVILDLFPMQAKITIQAFNNAGLLIAEGQGEDYSTSSTDDAHVEIEINSHPISINRLKFSILSASNSVNRAHVHLREIRILD
jgi:hypothetical protein